MTQAETVSRDSRSYRQGLVLGLTMAEVFLLLVFALLIALTALYNAERNKRKELEAHKGDVPVITAAEKKWLSTLKIAITAAGADKVTKALDHLREDRDLEPLNQPERQFVSEIRRQIGSAKPEAILDQWRRLTLAVHPLDKLPERLAMGDAIAKTIPGERDPERITELIQKSILAEKRGEHDWPPIINLSEANGYFFEKGKAELTPDFEHQLKAVIVPQLQQLARQYGVTTIEVIGHTDEQKISQRTSNLDWFMLDIVNNTGKISALIPADNAGLGLARAAAVMRVLTQDDQLREYTVLPLSAGQLINVGDKIATGAGGDDRERRRIEIRLRRSNPVGILKTRTSGADAR